MGRQLSLNQFEWLDEILLNFAQLSELDDLKFFEIEAASQFFQEHPGFTIKSFSSLLLREFA